MSCYPDTTDWSCYPGGDAAVDAMDPTLKAWAEEMAWTTLAALTAHQISLCPVIARPCIRRPRPARFHGGYILTGSTFNPLQINGNWINAWCGGCAGTCSHPLAELSLPGPVGAIVEVMIDGLVLPANAYRVDNGNLLVRQDGGVWPSTQNLNAPHDAEGAWSVTYYRGWVPGATVNKAVGILATEYVKSCTNGGAACRLPTGVTSITRQGVSMEIQGDMFENGLTGIREVDAVVRILNPNALKTPPVIMSPDTNRIRLTSLGAQLPAGGGGGYGEGGYGE